MKILRANDVQGEIGQTFTGTVELRRLLDFQHSAGSNVSLVRFEDGARTNWHVHPGEQILIVIEGAGRVGTADEQYTIGPGDVVYCAPNERHWHGAQPGQQMAHFSITTVGPPTWFEAPED